MALPTLPSYWTSRYKNVHEKAMVQRRTHEADFRDQWDRSARYFQNSNVRTTKQRAWTSDQSFQSSMDAFKRKGDAELKTVSLARRRSQLQRLLKAESEQYQAELKGLSLDNFGRLEDMKSRSDEIKTSRETERKKIADVRLYEHWKKNNPDLRKLDEEHHKKYVINQWGVQKDVKEQEAELAREEEKRLNEKMERKRRAAMEEERKEQESRLEGEKKLAGELLHQVDELKTREAEAERLKKEQGDLQRQQWELDNLEEKRIKLDEERKKRELNTQLTRQYKAQLRRKAKEVQEALEMDRKILESLATEQADTERLQSTRRDKARADAVWMKQVVEEQLKLEKAREAELDMLYRDEAARQWQKREAEWERERIARERLMSEVLQDRQEQIKVKMEGNRLQQLELLQLREELLRELEVAQQMTHRENEEEEEQKKTTRRQLSEQIFERNQVQDMARLRLEDEQRKEREAEDDYEEMLRQEASRMSLRDYEPKSYPRQSSRRSAWD